MKAESITKLKSIMTARQSLSWLFLEEPAKQLQTLCMELNRDFICPGQYSAFPHLNVTAQITGIPLTLASLIDYTPSTQEGEVMSLGLTELFWLLMNDTWSGHLEHERVHFAACYPIVRSLRFLRGKAHIHCWRGQFTDITNGLTLLCSKQVYRWLHFSWKKIFQKNTSDQQRWSQ